jgi:hypothetical protein
MSTPIVLYSTNTWLANKISKKYYSDEHWVWCSPYFDAGSNPPSSTPGEIYRDLRQATSRGDRHNLKILANKAGVYKGAVFKRKARIIDKEQARDIVSVIDAVETVDFRPLLYVIPVTDEVLLLMKEVPIRDRAHPLSTEYIIERLPRRLFDIIEP